MRDPLADVFLDGDTDPAPRIRVGTVTDDSPVEVNIGGTDGIPAAHLAAYTPTIGHTVLIIQPDNDSAIILDQIISGG